MMEKTFCCILLTILFHTPLLSQTDYWQQRVDQKIKVTLNDKDQSLDGFQEMNYQNNSPDTIHFIWMHLWPNAYKNDRTAFSEQLLNNNRTDFYFSDESAKGYINRLQFKVDNITAAMEDHPEHQDIIKIVLPFPLAPGQRVLITTPFHVKLPRIFSRSGRKKGFYAITQWYPKPAVYDASGWHPMPYLDQGEFYSEFGHHDITITTPEGYIIAATGNAEPSAQKNEQRFQQDNIHDFAWFASRDFKILEDTMVTGSGKEIKLLSYYLPQQEKQWKNSISYMKDAIRTRSEWIGDYPYDVVKVVGGYQGEGSGGMEYPTITVINETSDSMLLDMVIAHEIGHNWFYAAIANNERTAPWLDEGLNTYYDNRYRKIKYGKSLRQGNDMADRFGELPERSLIRAVESIKRSQPIQTSSDSFNSANYGLMAYHKAAWWFEELEKKTGTPLFDSIIRTWYQKYKFRHAGPAEFQQHIMNMAGGNSKHLSALSSNETLEESSKKTTRLALIFNNKDTDKFRYINFGPLAGYNHYDGIMPGITIHNYQFPLPRLRFLAAPMYGTSSKTITGLAHLSYNWYPSGSLHSMSIGLNAARFTANSYEGEGEDINLHYNKLSPFVKLTLKERSALSKKETWIRMRSFFFREDALSFNTIIDGADTTYTTGKLSAGRSLQQLTLYTADHRVLYPYEMDLNIDVNNQFTRIAFTGQYFFNYGTKKKGLSTRFFAGKFIYHGAATTAKQLETERYHLNLTGANGYEDYTYSNYFAGRNEYSGWKSQQIMMRDGGFKTRTDLLSSKIGKTDDWLAAINLNADIPDRYNPLALLPVKIPLKLFADIGSYAEAWDEENEYGRILFDAGLQVSLFSDMVNIYLPFIMSKPFRNYNQSILGDKKFGKSISFSIDIQKVSSRKMLAKLGL